MDAGIGLGLVIAFLGGIVSFASPCCLPLVPAYVGYMVGTTADDGTADRRAALYQSLAFVAGLLGGLHRPVGLGRAHRLCAARLRRDPPPAGRRDPRLHGPERGRGHQHLGPLPRGPPAGRPDGHRHDGLRLGGAEPARATAGRPSSGSSSPPAGPRASARSSAGSSAWPRSARAWSRGPSSWSPTRPAWPSRSSSSPSGATAVSHRLGWFRDHYRLVSAITGGLLVVVGFLMITNTFVPSVGPLHPARFLRSARMSQSVPTPALPRVERDLGDDLEGGLAISPGAIGERLWHFFISMRTGLVLILLLAGLGLIGTLLVQAPAGPDERSRRPTRPGWSRSGPSTAAGRACSTRWASSRSSARSGSRAWSSC